MMSEVGHNSELTPAERKALFMNHYLPIAAQLAKVQEAQAEYKKLRKLAKADKIALSDIDFALKCAEVDDGGILVDRLKREAEIASWFALPVDFQPDMFGDFDREPGEDRARREGRKAGATGEGANPYDENSKEGRAWAEEWRVEQKKNADAFLSAQEKLRVVTDKDELIKGSDVDDPFEDAPAEAAE
jgi:hypothetical protein